MTETKTEELTLEGIVKERKDTLKKQTLESLATQQMNAEAILFHINPTDYFPLVVMCCKC